MMLCITKTEVTGPQSLRLVFNNGVTKEGDVKPLLDSSVFGPLKDPDCFARVTVDPICGTVVWPNGADLAPEALYELTVLVAA